MQVQAFLAVIGVEVRLGDLLVADAALRHDRQLEPFRVSPADRVGRMAVIAHGEPLVRLPLLRHVDAAVELLLDPVVAAAAGVRHVLRVDARLRRGDRLHAVGRVAVRAHRGHRQPALQESLAVDAFGVPFDDVVLLSPVPHGGLVPLPVAPGAQVRHVRRERPGLRVLLPQDAVRPVALVAGRGIRVVLRQEQAVPALLVHLPHLGVAGGAFDFLRDRLARPGVRGVYLRVTLAASDLRVARIPDLSLVDDERPPVLLRLDVGISVTAHAIGVGHPLVVENFPHLVRLVAVHARRQRVEFLFPELPADHFPVYGFDLRVALRACRRDVLPVDG